MSHTAGADVPVQRMISFPVDDQEAQDLAAWALEHHEKLVILVKQVVMEAIFR